MSLWPPAYMAGFKGMFSFLWMDRQQMLEQIPVKFDVWVSSSTVHTEVSAGELEQQGEKKDSSKTERHGSNILFFSQKGVKK